MRKSEARKGIRSLKIGAAMTVAAVAAAVAVTATPAWASTFSLSQSQVAAAGGTTLYFTGGSAFASTHQVRFVTPAASTCPAAYNTANAGGITSVNAGTWTQRSTSVAYINTPALVAGTTYEACIYAATASGANYTTDTSTATVTAQNMGTLSSAIAQAATTVTLTTAAGLLSGTTYATEFVTASTCAATYTAVAPGTVVASTTTTKNVTNNVLTITVPVLTAATPYLVCVYNGSTATVSTLAVRGRNTIATFSSTLPITPMTPTGGSSGTATTVTITAPTAIFTGAPAALVARDSCPATYGAGAVLEPYAAFTTKISTSKVAVTIPATAIVSGSDVFTPWNVCLYANNSSGALLATPGVYSVAPVLTVTGAAIASSSGPAQGLTSITVTGMTGIPTTVGATLSATLGGLPITGIVALDATSFTGVTPPHAAGPVSLIVTTAAGSKTKANAYTYTYGITVNPKTSPNTANPTLDIMGAGFGALTFTDIVTGIAVSANEAHVVLTDNAWNLQPFTVSQNVFTTDLIFPATQCANVLPISDSEIVCTLDLANHFTAATQVPTVVSTVVPNGSYTVTVVNDGMNLDPLAYNLSVVSSDSTFTVASF